MNRTGIEYLDYTWNPIVMRCTRISEACDNCWHLRSADRLKENPKIPMAQREAYAGDRAPILVKDRLIEPSRVKKPSIIGIQFMGDLFHEKLPPWIIDEVFEETLQAPQHTYLILTKRHKELYKWADSTGNRSELILKSKSWMGVTVENDRHLDRIETLLSIPAAVHFISAEPLLGPLNIDTYPGLRCRGCGYTINDDFINGDHRLCRDQTARLDLVICGAETGVKKKRHMDLDWARSLRDHCNDAGAAFIFKKDSAGRHELDGRVWEELPKGYDHADV